MKELKDIGIGLRASDTALGGENRKTREGEIEKRAKFGGSEIPTKKSIKLSAHGEREWK